jgi:AraC family transcriptional regulator
MTNSAQGKFHGSTTERHSFKNFSLVESLHSSNQQLSRHSHEHPYISILLQGAYTEQCGTNEWECAAGQVIFHPADETHSNRFFDNGGTLLNLEILPSLDRQLHDGGIRMDLRRSFRDPVFLQLGLKLRRELRAPDPLSGFAVEGMLMELIALSFRRGSDEVSDCGWIERVAMILREQFVSPPSLAQLAGIAGVHPVHLARAFRKRYGSSVGEYVRTIRVQAACHELKNTGRPIVEIAAATGFSDQSHLSRTLRKFTGVSPLGWRAAG